MDEALISNPTYLEIQQIIQEVDLANPPEVLLKLSTQAVEGDIKLSPGDVAGSTAIQCYAGGTAKITNRTKEWERKIITSTLEAGHLTTRQHFYVGFQIIGISRHALHEIFHAYPYYNSEQQSQRYVEAILGSLMEPSRLTPDQLQMFMESGQFMNQAYFELLPILGQAALKELGMVYPGFPNKMGETGQARVKDKAVKTAQEVARYVLPLGQKSKLVHSLSVLQLVRLWHASRMGNFTPEAKYTIAKMLDEVIKIHPDFINELERFSDYDWDPQSKFLESLEPIPPIEYDPDQLNSIRMPNGYGEFVRAQLVDALRLNTGRNLTEEQAMQLLFNLKVDPELGDLFDIGMHSQVSSVLRQVTLNFQTRLSHAADSQRQRHRTIAGTTPNLTQNYHGPDYITPLIIRRAGGELEDKYHEIMQKIYQNYEMVVASGVPDHIAELLLPNSHALYIMDRGDLFDTLHMERQRLCFNAQEEIFFILVARAQAILEMLPEARSLLLAPCGTRKVLEQKPYCPEGTRYCGIPVWNKELEVYEDLRNF